MAARKQRRTPRVSSAARRNISKAHNQKRGTRSGRRVPRGN